jgi:hypothetical protein
VFVACALVFFTTAVVSPQTRLKGRVQTPRNSPLVADVVETAIVSKAKKVFDRSSPGVQRVTKLLGSESQFRRSPRRAL